MDSNSQSALVLKFGGTSLAGAEAIGRVMDIIRKQARLSRVVAVVSAMAGVTDRLLALGRDSLEGKKQKVEAGITYLRELHQETFTALAPSAENRDWVQQFLDQQFAEIGAIAQGVALLHEFSDRTRDKMLSYGEILCSNLLARALQASNSNFCHSDARDWIVGEWTRHGVIVDFAQTEERIRQQLLPLLDRGLCPIVPGFVCQAKDGETATLGRNGSDYSSSIIGAALRAREIWIYTDVDGIMTADPNLVAEARVLSQISYQEAAEMSYFGAKVLHPKTMIPAVIHRVPIRIKNTFSPGAAGTLIAERSLRRPVVKTVTSVRDLALVNIEGNGMVGIPDVASRSLEALAREDVEVMMISQSSSEHNICIVIKAGDADRALQALRKELALEIQRNLVEDIELSGNVATISIIGAGMRGTPGISGKFFEALGKCRINVLAIAQGSSELNISAAIREQDYRHAVQAVHSAFGLTRDVNIFLFGCGNIGRTLLRQIHENRRQLARTLQINLKVLGVANSRTLRFSPSGLGSPELKLLGSGTPLAALSGSIARPSTTEIFDRIAGTYKSDVVIVDATGADLVDTHIEGLRRGFHVVTANKKPLTTSLRDYGEIQRMRRRKGLNYQYEATFGAGLPLLSTLQDLLQTGDRILHIEGCLSGTLGFICTRMDEGLPFSRAVSEAMALGYTEPDPRDDLSGTDVARKSLIIARELGLPIEMRDIALKEMIPRRFFRLSSVSAFIASLPTFDSKMREENRKARSQREVLRYVAEISETGCRVGLKRVPRDSPIGRLAGPDNILVFKTLRYYDYPLVIQGPGAGAGVTAAGVLSDILKIAKWI